MDESQTDYLKPRIEKILELGAVVTSVGIIAGLCTLVVTSMQIRGEEHEIKEAHRLERREQVNTLYQQISDIEIKAAGPDGILDVEEKIKMARDLGYVKVIDKESAINLEIVDDLGYKYSDINGLELSNGKHTYIVPNDKVKKYLQE